MRFFQRYLVQQRSVGYQSNGGHQCRRGVYAVMGSGCGDDRSNGLELTPSSMLPFELDMYSRSYGCDSCPLDELRALPLTSTKQTPKESGIIDAIMNYNVDDSTFDVSTNIPPAPARNTNKYSQKDNHRLASPLRPRYQLMVVD